MDIAALRDRMSMAQGEFATLIGVSQAAISQYEAGTRNPGGHAAVFLERLAVAIQAPDVVESVGERSVAMPAQRWVRVIDDARVGMIKLPVRLDWSPRVIDGWIYGDEVHRRELYRLVLDVGTALDLRVFIDPDELVAWAPDLLVARRTRPRLDRLVERLGETEPPNPAEIAESKAGAAESEADDG